MTLALEAYDVLRAVELKMGIGDNTTWTQLRAANPEVYAMQGRNGGRNICHIYFPVGFAGFYIPAKPQ